LGTLDLFIFGRKGAGKTAVANMLVEGNDDVVSVLGWEDGTLTASTAWKDARTRRGARNVRITEAKGFDEEEDEVSSSLFRVFSTNLIRVGI
jgi:predicted GTPase